MSYFNIPGYKMIKQLGVGGFSEVWLAEKNDVKYAIKIPKIEIQKTFTANDIESFIREADLWKKLQHENIVKIFEFDVKPYPHIVMEYCEASLREKIPEIKLDDAINIAIKIAEALEYAHYRGIVHRDIKPENILMCGKNPKLSDWGIAKVLLRSSTRSGFVGTPIYSAPEQLDPDTYGDIDQRTDIWQFGCLLYEMIEKQPPFYAEYPGQLAIQILTKPSRKFNRTPEWLQNIIAKCLTKKKENRWRSVSLVIELLRKTQSTKSTTGKELQLAETSSVDIKANSEFKKEIIELEIDKTATLIEKVSIAVDKLGRFSVNQIMKVSGLNKKETEKILELFATKVTDDEWVSEKEWNNLIQQFDSLTQSNFWKINDIAEKLGVSTSIIKQLAKEINAIIITDTIINPKLRLILPRKKIDVNALAIGYNTTPQVITATLLLFHKIKSKIFTVKKHFLLRDHSSEVWSVAWSPDGKYIASGSKDETVRVWDAATGKLLRTLEGHTDSVNAVAWSPDSKYIASGSSDKTVRVWDAATGKLLRTLEGHNWSVLSVAWSPDGKYIASGSSDEIVRVWDATTGSLLRTLEGHKNWVSSVAWSPDGTKIASGSLDETVKVWNVTTDRLLMTLKNHTDCVNAVAWSPDSKYIASGSSDYAVRVWNATTGKLLRTLEGHTAYVSSVTWSPDGKYIASGSGDNTVRVWNAATGILLMPLEGHSSPVRSVAWSPDGKYIASGSGELHGKDYTVRIWNIIYEFWHSIKS